MCRAVSCSYGLIRRGLAACKTLARKKQAQRDSAVCKVNNTFPIDRISLQKTSGLVVLICSLPSTKQDKNTHLGPHFLSDLTRGRL